MDDDAESVSAARITGLRGAPPARSRSGAANTSSHDTRAVICIITNRVRTAPIVTVRPVRPSKKKA